MRTFSARRFMRLASALGVAAAALSQGAPPAHAVVGANEVAVSAAGSDTTQDLMGQILAHDNNLPVTVGGVAKTARTYNIPASPTSGVFVDGDADCPDTTWTKDPGAPAAANTHPPLGTAPFGSTAGRNFLADEETAAAGTKGCVDVARSSGAPRAAAGGDKNTFEYYAFAMDAVSWASTSLKAPSTLSRTQLAAIYDCTIRDWADVGGQSGPIVRYFPQAGSGTRSFFSTDILGKASGYTPPSVGGTSPCTTNPVFVEENEAQQVAAGDVDQAILPYSAALWAFHSANAINPTLDRRNGARIGGITTEPTNCTVNPCTAADALKSSVIKWVSVDTAYELNVGSSGTVKESNIKQHNAAFSGGANQGEFPGVRYVYNVLDNLNNLPGYEAAKQLLGFPISGVGTVSPLCNGASFEKGKINSNGFAPLSKTVFAGENPNGTACRYYAGVA